MAQLLNNGKARKIFLVFFVLLLVMLDQLSKYLTFHHNFFNFINFSSLLYVQNFKNYNFVFGIPLPQPVSSIIYLAVFALLAFHFKKNYFQEYKSFSAWLLIFTGAGLNFFERLALGYVRDFIGILTGIFNLADLYILLGIIILIFQRSKIKD